MKLAPGGGCSFDQLGTLCSCWGTPSTINSSISYSNGTLTMNPNANAAGAQSACTETAVPFTAAGAFVEVSATLSGSNALTALSIGTSPDIFEVSVINGQLRTDDGSNQGTSTLRSRRDAVVAHSSARRCRHGVRSLARRQVVDDTHDEWARRISEL